jgi:hypothetical protein
MGVLVCSVRHGSARLCVETSMRARCVSYRIGIRLCVRCGVSEAVIRFEKNIFIFLKKK